MTAAPTTPSSSAARPTPATPAPTNRLGYDDEVFLRTATVLGMPVVAQTAWRFDTRIPVEDVERLCAALAKGPLHRLVVRSRVPAARSRFVRAGARAPLAVSPEPVDPADLTGWLDACAEVELDPVKGPAWSFAMAHTTDGGTVVAYQASHVICDGGLKIGAVVDAVRGTPRRRLPVDDLAAAQVTLRDDLRDAAGMLRQAYAGLRAARRAAPVPALDAQTSKDRPVPEPQPDDGVRQVLPFIGVDCPAAEWHAVAERAGGTANALFVAVTVEVLLRAGIAEAGRPVAVSLPVSLRGPDDLRSNTTSGVTIAVDTELRDGVGIVPDLAAVRARSREQFRALSDGTRPDTRAFFRPLLQILPDALAKRMADTITTPLCLASNLGRLDPAYVAPFGVPSRGVLFRALSLGATRGQLRRMRGGVTSWWSESGEQCTLGLRGLDPDRVPDSDTLRRLVGEVYARWGLTARFW